MAAPVPSRGVTNLLEYKPDQDVISPAAWKADAALTFHKLLNNLQRAATMYAVVDPKTSAKNIADWALMMIVLLLFLQKQNLALVVYLFGSVLSLPD